jgi:lipopolysaccharide/colanic/teichoic acid biosynthesis glycosyltransferase
MSRFGRAARPAWAVRVKTAMDRVGAAVGLFVGLPAMAATALAVRAFLGPPVLFRQQRPGRDGAPFELIKFRTMAEGEGSDDARLNRFGRFLRALSLDELPELWNVLRGEMSLVGPRPLLMRYLSLYTPEQRRRHEVQPGITGWAQIHGRNALGWSQRLMLDVWYVDHWSLALDLRILASTVLVVLTRKGISFPGKATMPEFQGENAGASSPLGDSR